jgi:uncharacterized membrane protein YphA (DoxX/SURF4 family)
MGTFTTVLCLILAALFLLSGLTKLVGVEAIEASAKALGISHRLHVTAGILELSAVAGLVIGVWWQGLRIAAAAGLTIMMILAVGYHMRARDKPANTSVPAVLGVLALIATIFSILVIA